MVPRRWTGDGLHVVAFPVHFRKDARLALVEQKATQKDGETPAQAGAAPAPPVPAVRPAPAAPAPSPKRRVWIWGAVALLGLGLGALAYSQLWLARPMPVGVEIAALAPVTRVLAVNGRIAAVLSVDVKSVVSGRLVDLAVAEGDQVTADQTLAQVDAAAQTALVRQAVAGLDAALVAQQKAVEAYDRSTSLGDTVARTVRETDAHAVQSAAQEVAHATAVLDQAQVVVQTYTIRAPVSGTVVELAAEQGQVVGPTIALLTLADLGDLVVEADVDEAYATQIAVDQPAVLQLAGETATRNGHVSFVSTRVDEATGGLTIKMAFDTPVKAPLGLTVTANIVVDSRDAALSIPRTAMQTTAGGASVFVVLDGAAHIRPVTVVDWPAARLIVTAGLAEGDAVIADATGITDGQAVAVGTP